MCLDLNQQGANIKLLFKFTGNNIHHTLLIIMPYKQFMCPGEKQCDFVAITNMTTHQLENLLICFYGEGHERQKKGSHNIKLSPWIDFISFYSGITATAITA